MKLELDKDDTFEELAEHFRLFIMQNFNRCLKNTELSNSKKEQLCTEFLAELCVNLDQGEWEHNGKYYRPTM
ncbi:hypothetical protein ACJJIF_08955 [Microbulbifer sp. SSSA002]|uniref:hypothetical protein n=1 Tax=Microbulbifer sp. SSSA002 TaxID=3243376 RepID=UPI004039E2DA